MACAHVVMKQLAKMQHTNTTHSARLHTAQRTNAAFYSAIVLSCVLVDQLVKAYMRSYLAEGVSISFIPGVLNLQLVYNEGAAFSIGEGNNFLFILLAIAVALGAFVWVLKSPSMPFALVCSLACVAGGGLGNLIDRLAFGAVCDFFAFAFINFPIFNVADIFITCAAFASIICFVRWDTEQTQPEEVQAHDVGDHAQ